MRIISDFEDYYDKAVPWDSGEQPVYVRETKELKVTRHQAPAELTLVISKIYEVPWFCGYRELERVGQGVILFCGKIFPYFWLLPRLGDKGLFAFDYADLRGLAQKSERKDILAKLDSRDKPRHGRRRRWISAWFADHRQELSVKSWDSYVKGANLTVPDEASRFLNSPVSVWEEERNNVTITISPLLRTIGFARVVDPYTAYQEIEMYVGNNLARQVDPIVDIPDDLKAQSKGFNEWSFRRRPKG